MIIYIINLDYASERLQNSFDQISLFSFQALRVPAIYAKNIKDCDMKYVSPGVAAIWKSHIKAIETFLESNEEFAVITEDDFVITDIGLFRKSKQVFSDNELDLLQVGFLTTGIDVFLKKFVENHQYRLFRLVSKIAGFVPFLETKIQNRMRLLDVRRFDKSLIPFSFLPGAHCYIISRRLATEILNMNSPQFLSTDDFFTALARMRSFNIARLKTSAVSQSQLPSQVGKRFLQY